MQDGSLIAFFGYTSTGTVTTDFQRAFHESEIGELID